MSHRNYGQLRLLCRLMGSRVGTLLLVNVPLGILIGVIELVTATVLYAVLEEFNLVGTSGMRSSVMFGLNPTAALLLFALLTGTLRYFGQLLPAVANLEFHRRLRTALVRSILGGVTERSVIPVAEASHLLNTVIPRSGDFLQSVASAAVGVCLFLIVFVGMVHLSFVLTAVALVFATLLGLVLVAIRNQYGKEIEKIYSLTRSFNANFLKAARNSNFLRICGANEEEERRLRGNADEYVRTNSRYYRAYAFGQNLPQVASVFVVVGILWVNARMALVSPEGLVPLVYLLARTAGSIGSFAVSMGQIQQNHPYFAELCRHYPGLFPPQAAAPDAQNSPAEVYPLVVDELSFGRRAPLVRPLSLMARRGDVVIISGASGKGKTSLIMTLIGILNPLAGKVSWGGESIETIDPVSLRRRLGYAGPEPYLLDADIRTNLVFGMERDNVSTAEIEHVLRLACAEFVFDLEGGLLHRLQEAGEGISAGQKQRLSLARCLLRAPDILLLDEATANIDEETEGQIMSRIRTAYPEMLIIAVSHRASLRRYATKTIEI